MKPSLRILSLLSVILLGLAGCGKPAQVALPPTTVNGATIDMAKLTQALSSSTAPEVKKNLSGFFANVRYTQYDQAAANLDKIAADPSLTEDQKKAVADAIEQVKQVTAAAAAAKPAQ